MAARIRKVRNDEEHRARIRTTQLIKRLTAHVLGQVEMVPSQVTAALGLLRKTLPDLANMTISGDPNNPLMVTGIERRIISEAERQDASDIDAEGVRTIN